jgi:hypothetical protein
VGGVVEVASLLIAFLNSEQPDVWLGCWRIAEVPLDLGHAVGAPGISVGFARGRGMFSLGCRTLIRAWLREVGDQPLVEHGH